MQIPAIVPEIFKFKTWRVKYENYMTANKLIITCSRSFCTKTLTDISWYRTVSFESCVLPKKATTDQAPPAQVAPLTYPDIELTWYQDLYRKEAMRKALEESLLDCPHVNEIAMICFAFQCVWYIRRKTASYDGNVCYWIKKGKNNLLAGK